MPSNLERVSSISRIAGADFSGDNPGEYRFCVVQSDASVVLCGNGARPLGVLLGKNGSGKAIEVGVGGRLLVVCGGTVTAGQAGQSDGNGALVTQNSTGCVAGIILESGVAGDIVSLEFAPQGAP